MTKEEIANIQNVLTRLLQEAEEAKHDTLGVREYMGYRQAIWDVEDALWSGTFGTLEGYIEFGS